MGRRAKMNVVAVAAAAKTISGEDARKRLVDSAVTESTLAQYGSRIAILSGFLTEMGELTLTEELFLRFLEAVRQGDEPCAAATAEGYRCAILHAQLAQRLWVGPSGEEWAAEDRVKKACRGFKYGGKKNPREAARPRGSITLQMFDELVGLARKKDPRFVSAIIVLFGAALRVGELVRIKAGDFVAPRLKVRGDKRARANNDRPNEYEKVVLMPLAVAALNDLQKATEEGQLLFPRSWWSIPHLRAFIKSSAAELGWPADLTFDGPHCLRHGGVARILAETEGNPELREAALQLSGVCQRRYGASNEERLARSSAKAEESV